MSFTDLVGQEFGSWKVIRHLGTRGNYSKRYWLCECQCGNTREVRADSLKGGGTKQCKNCQNKTHGLSSSPLYAVWNMMKARCENPNHKSFHHYGGRGVSVCERWQDFEAFYEDMAPRPQKGDTLERKNVDGDYCPSNCIWASMITQNNNRRNNVRYTFQGETKTIPEWSRKIGVNKKTLYNRIYMGWDIERTLTEPVNK